MKLIIDLNSRLVDLEGIRSISVEPISEETRSCFPDAPEGNFGLWANFDPTGVNEDCELIWIGTETECRGRLAYIARKNAALDLRSMP